MISVAGRSRRDVRAACSGATPADASRSDARSARNLAGGDGAARHPYHHAKHIRDLGRGILGKEVSAMSREQILKLTSLSSCAG